jgi:hypothetical protein
MPLDQSCTKHVGETLVLKPTYGWGWRRDGAAIRPDDFAPIDAAGIVTFRASDFLLWDGELRHVIGRIESRDQLFSGLWVTCAVMLTGKFDFREGLCLRYDLSLGPFPPTGEWPLAGGTPRWEGFGVVAESEKMIDEYLASLSKPA